MTMSAHWLNAVYNGQGINLGNQTWYQTLAKFKQDLLYMCPGGTLLQNIVPGKLRFYQRPNKGLTVPGWRIKYQGDRSVSGNTVFPPSYTVNRLTARRIGDNPPGTAVKPQFDWLLQELQDGEDVEIHIGWVRPNGTRNGGHSLGVRGALRHGNKMFIWTTDDARQDPCTPGLKPSDTVPAVNGGLRHAHLSQVLLNANGSMHLAGLQPNEVELVTSESPPPVGFLPGDMNCDGMITVSDIAGFVLALTDPAGYAAAYPDCNILHADLNGDGLITVGDIGFFVQLLTGG
jgi:hypothetical protein